MNKRTVEDYLNLPYTIEVIRDNDPENPGWVATVAELSGCMTQADTFEELGEMIDEAMRLWLEAALEDNVEIPEPRLEADYSGKFVVRVPTSLHRALAIQSEREGVSLNSYINVALASYTGRQSTQKAVSQSQYRNWPGLSVSAFQVMAAQGLREEAEHVDEALFGHWLSRGLAQIEKAHHSSQPQSALPLIENMLEALSGCESLSPVMESIIQMLNFQNRLMQSQIESTETLRQKAEFLHDQIDKVIGKVNKPQAEANSEFNMNYAQITTHSESQFAETLFQTTLSRKTPGTSK